MSDCGFGGGDIIGKCLMMFVCCRVVAVEGKEELVMRLYYRESNHFDFCLSRVYTIEQRGIYIELRERMGFIFWFVLRFDFC
jgi:hypothetical protein